MVSIRCWGVRGSCAAAGPETAGVGGNTSCVEVRAGGRLVIFDAGTGLRALGAALMAEAGAGGGVASAGGSVASAGVCGEGSGVASSGVDAHLFLSHFHWDHIQGFPFFQPAYLPQTRLAVYGPERCVGRAAGPAGDVRAALEA